LSEKGKGERWVDYDEEEEEEEEADRRRRRKEQRKGIFGFVLY
jgi:hypothetical protein